MSSMASALTSVAGSRIPLCDVDIAATLRDLLAEVAVTQTYRNDEPAGIEAVYTFPLPLDAVLLGLHVEIGGRVLRGVVIEKKAAQEKYEDAVEMGDAAVMLEVLEPGLYTMNVGNLLPGEIAKITFRYAMLYRWTGDSLRFFLPTTVAPRYGESPHEPHQTPDHSLTVENRFSLRVEVLGALRGAQFASATHKIEQSESADSLVLSLVEPKAVMDRDFALAVKAPQAARDFVLCGEDGAGTTAIASFQPFFPGLQQPRPLTLAIVIDCSGSMSGDSMTQAKQALHGILENLTPQDRVSLIAFGNHTNLMTERPVACNKTNIAKAKRFVKSLEADMGGTALGNALRTAYETLARAENADIFLITDGEITQWQPVVADAVTAGRRVFTVGVGTAVTEAFLREIASATGGSCELVTPREGMATRVVRHFERMRAPRARRVTVHWPAGATALSPSRHGPIFEGDTVLASATFPQPVFAGEAVLEVETDRGDIRRQAVRFGEIIAAPTPDKRSTVARLAAASRLLEPDGDNALQTALTYQLVSNWTNCIVVAPRADEDKAFDIPALRKVPQTLAAGWGGTGRIMASDSGAGNAAYMTSEVRAARRVVTPRDESMAASGGRSPDVPETLPEPYRRLLEFVNYDVSYLEPTKAFDLLSQSDLLPQFERLFEHARSTGIDPRRFAPLVVARLVTDQLQQLMNATAQRQFTQLRRFADNAVATLRKVARSAAKISESARDSIGVGIIGDYDSLTFIHRMVEIASLLDHLEAAVQDSTPAWSP
jgi:Ca-activated chloride channel family protein